MNLKDLERSISAKTGLSSVQASAVVAALLETMEETLYSGGRIIFRNICTLHVKTWKATRKFSPKQGSFVDVPARRHLAITPSDKLNLNGK